MQGNYIDDGKRDSDFGIDGARVGGADGLGLGGGGAWREGREGFLGVEARGGGGPVLGTWYVENKAPRLRGIEFPGTRRPGYPNNAKGTVFDNFQKPRANNM